jgi:hypothetical protein
MAGLFDFFSGTQSKLKPINKDALSQLMQLIQGGGGLQNNPLFQSGQSHLQSLLSNEPGAFEAFEAPFKEQFEQEIVPGIAERFAGLGTGAGSLNSSGLNNALAQAGKGLSTNLAGLRSGLQMQASQQGLQYAQQPIMNLLQALGVLPGLYAEKPGQGGLLQGLAGGFAGGLGQGYGKQWAGG